MKLFLIFLFVTFKAYPETQVFFSIAKSKGKIAYFENHTILLKDQKPVKSMTEYFDSSGKRIGIMRSDFSSHLGAPEYIVQDFRHHSFQGLRWISKNLETFAQEQGRKQIINKFPVVSDQVQIAGPGLIYYISSHLAELISGKILDFQYLIPGRGEAFDFYIKNIAHNNDVAEFEIKMKSLPLRIFSPRMKLIYHIRKRRLIFFEGPSHLRDEKGQMMNVDINYEYEN